VVKGDIVRIIEDPGHDYSIDPTRKKLIGNNFIFESDSGTNLPNDPNPVAYVSIDDHKKIAVFKNDLMLATISNRG